MGGYANDSAGNFLSIPCLSNLYLAINLVEVRVSLHVEPQVFFEQVVESGDVDVAAVPRLQTWIKARLVNIEKRVCRLAKKVKQNND